MKRLFATLVTAICGAALMSMYLVPTAEAAPYTPKNGVVFNNPAKSRAQERRIQTTLDNAVSATPGGEIISIVMYLFNDNSMLNRLISAHKRGVRVQVIVDDGGNSAQVKKLRKALAVKTKYNNYSFVKMCKRGCMSNYPYSTVHGKVYAFSKVGTTRNVSIIASANPHGVNIYNSWNNSHTIANNAVVYTAMRKYFLDMLKDNVNHSYGNQFKSPGTDRYGNLNSGKYQISFYPRRPARIAYLDVLNNVSCRTASNMGSKGRTVVRMGMWGFTNPRMDVAKRLWALHNAGCKVDVTLNRGRASRTIMRQLVKKSKKYGQMRLEDAWRDKNRNDYGELYIHHKALIVNGRVYGKNQRVVWTGSQNLTSNGSLYNDDMILRIVDSGTYFAYSKNFSYIQAHYAKRLRKTPPPIVLKSKRNDARVLTPEQNVERQAELNEGG
jgi:phosphatidylserine/phosphatidylglycerophosphate/cardiolipin synthase-like enzyme